MPKILTQTEIDQFHEQGFVSPIRVMSAAEALAYRRRLERFERETGGPLGGHLRHKTHLLFIWLADLVRHPRILDAVETFTAQTYCAGRRISLSRRRQTRPSSPDTRIQPIGA